MKKVVTLRSGQFLLWTLSLLAIGGGGGMMALAMLWRLPLAARNWASFIEISGMIGFIVLSIWKSCDDWAVKTGAVTQT